MNKGFGAALAAAVMLAGTAQAAVLQVSTGRTVPSNGGQTTQFTTGIVEERFRLLSGDCQQQRAGNFEFDSTLAIGPISPGGAFNAQLVSGATPNQALPPGYNGALLRAGAPIDNTSCYLVAPQPFGFNGSSSISLTVDPAGALPALYFGFQWGSIDSYNSLSLIATDGETSIPVTFNGVLLGDGETFGGGDLLAALTAAGVTAPEGYNTYVDFYFDASENFGGVIFGASGRAFEVDNLAYSTTAQTPNPSPFVTSSGIAVGVPAPASVGLLGAGLAGAAALRGRRRR